jgi:hypothetical protein
MEARQKASSKMTPNRLRAVSDKRSRQKKKAQIGTLAICALWITLLTFKHFRGRGPCGCAAPARSHAERPEKTSKSNEKR